MKNIFAALMIALFSASAFAGWGWGHGNIGGGWDPSHGHGRTNVTCSAADRGWEEHWGGHSSCESCLKKHGSCVETCSATYYKTVVEGQDYRGYKMTVESRGDSRYQTEREAIERCSYYYRYNNCHVVTTEESSETVSRRSCR